MDYSQMMQTIVSLAGKKTDVTAVQAMAERLGHPEKKFRTIHVAGTNGKGSVSLKIAHALGPRCGLFTSPHLFCFRERIQIGGQKISEQAVVELLEPILQIASQANIFLSYFEVCTLLAFVYFAREKVDFAVIEAGLGGRLDATNILAPTVSVITSIGLDHCELLGDSIEKIAQEKAGIIKANTPLVIGPSAPQAIIAPIAKSRGAPLTRVEGRFPHYGFENQAIATAVLQQLSIFSPTPPIELPCRFEQVVCKNKRVILDVAHNPQGIEKLIERLNFSFPNQPYRFIFSMSSTKDLPTCAALIRSAAASVYVLEYSHPRLAPLHELKKYFPVSASPEKCLQGALQEEGVIVICGSFFIMETMVKNLISEDPHIRAFARHQSMDHILQTADEVLR
jgi:dihydrofolate synthase/folylpolyglutamate synthase